VRLVGVAGLEREPRQVVVSLRQPQEALEAQDALERLRPVADGVEKAPAQLAVADAERLARRAGGGRADERVGRGAPPHGGHQFVRVRRLDTARLRAPHILERHALVAQLGGREAERRAGGADAKAHAEGGPARSGLVRPCGRAGDDQPSVHLDDVHAGVGQDATRPCVIVRPHAGHELVALRQLAVGHGPHRRRRRTAAG
jgi:hypothetical protein